MHIQIQTNYNEIVTHYFRGAQKAEWEYNITIQFFLRQFLCDNFFCFCRVLVEKRTITFCTHPYLVFTPFSFEILILSFVCL